MTSNTDLSAIWVNRARKRSCSFAFSLVGFPVRRHSEISVSGLAGSGSFLEDWYSHASAHCAVRRRHRNYLRGASLGWSVYSSRLRAFAYRHLCRFVLDQDRHVHEERLLGHASRGAHRCEHAAWSDLSTARRRRNSGSRRSLSGRAGPKVMRDRRRAVRGVRTGTAILPLNTRWERKYSLRFVLVDARTVHPLGR